MSKQLRLDPAQLTDVGRKRPHNEDNMAYVIPKDPQVMARKGALFIVADGMGGHAAGEVASEIAVDTVSNVYYQDDSEGVPVALLRAIKRANALIYQRAAENMLRSGMGTTCVAAVLRGKTAYIANVGDSRAYLIHDGQAKQISQDHSWVAEQVRAGLLTEDQARSHAQRNVITRCLGTQPDVEIDVFSEELQEGDAMVLCTDGLSGSISDEELRTIVDQHQPQESVYMLVERANENGGPDNITAIVVRVQEVGSDPPEIRHPVYAGDVGNIANDDTLPMGMAPAVSPGMPLRLENGRTPSSPLRYPTGPLPPPESMASPHAIVHMPLRKRNRLFYPALAMFVLLLATLTIGIFYYLFHKNVDSRLTEADNLITIATQEVQSNTPITALQNLSTAQMILRDVEQSPLTDSERQRTTSLLNGRFLVAVRSAITKYNATYNIATLPCSDTLSRPINLGSTNTQVSTLATLEDDKGTLFSYALGEDHKLYQLGQLSNNQYSLVNPLTTPGSIQQVAGDTTRLLTLLAQPAAGNTPAKYSLHVLTPNATGLLQDTNSPASIDPTLTQGGNLSLFVTAWQTEAYVIITSTAAPNTATIVGYEVSMQHTIPVLKPAGVARISISTSIMSVTAFPNHQLFLLLTGGTIQSLLFASGNQKAQSVLIREPIAPVLSVTATDFTPTTAVPAVNVMGPSSFLSLSQATLLVAGVAENAPHLYIVDGLYHRVLDLEVPQAVPSPTPTGSAITGTSGTGGATSSSAGGAVTMALLQQYASAPLLAHVTSIVADPKNAQLSLLTQSATLPLSLLSLDVSQKTPCNA